MSSVVKPHLSALHLNARSSNQHINESKNHLDYISFVFYFIGCSETFLTNSTGGGVVSYAEQNFVFQTFLS